MDIALVIFRAQVERGGAERYANDLSIALSERGHNVTLIASRGEAPAGVAFVRLGASGISRSAQYARFCRNVVRHLDDNQYDIVHACLPVPRCDIYHAHSGIESLTLRDGHLAQPTLSRQTVSKLLNRINRKRHAFARVESALINSGAPPTVLCLSNREREAARQAFPSAKEQFLTLYSFPDDARFTLDDVKALRKQMRKQLGLSDAQTMFLFVGNSFERKGLSTAIRALGKHDDPNAMLYVVGEGDTHKYTEIALRAGAMGRVMFTGQVDNVRGFFAAADATLLPSHAEPFGMVVVESILMGVPPIVSRIAGASEVVRDGHDGIVIDDSNDVGAWVDAMKRISDRTFRDTLSAACLEERERFSYQHHVDTLEAVYRERKSRNIR